MAICGIDCCSKCDRLNICGGCEATNGHPFGGRCIAADAISNNGQQHFEELKKKLICEINSLGIEHLKVDNLNLLNGFFVNLEYKLSNQSIVKFLNDNDIYFGNQIEIEDSERCLGVVANDEFILVCSYGCDGCNPKLILYKKLNSQ